MTRPLQRALSLLMIRDNLGNIIVNVHNSCTVFLKGCWRARSRFPPHLSADGIDSTQTKRGHSSISLLGAGNLQRPTRDFHCLKLVTAKVCFEYMPAYFQLWFSFPGKQGVCFTVCRQVNKIIQKYLSFNHELYKDFRQKCTGTQIEFISETQKLMQKKRLSASTKKNYILRKSVIQQNSGRICFGSRPNINQNHVCVRACLSVNLLGAPCKSRPMSRQTLTVTQTCLANF